MLTEGERAQLVIIERELAGTDPGLAMDLSGVPDHPPDPPWPNAGPRTVVCTMLLLAGLALMIACGIAVGYTHALSALLPLPWTGVSLSLASLGLATWWPETPSCRVEGSARRLPGLSRFRT